ncbi:MAG: hypothetical protein ACRCVJ_18505 [Clostridium sp.]|uniref:hypothetical protein n=1 Tax=Clostridium sp. TaxID=1506 RepID=UPI003F39D968
MKAVFNFKETELINEKIEDLALMLVFNEDSIDEILDDYDEVYDFVEEKLDSTNMANIADIEIEDACEECVYLYNGCFTGKGEEGLYPETQQQLQSLIDTHNEALKVFDKEQVRIMVRSNELWEDCNEQDFSLEEFLSMFKLVEE